MILDDLLKAIGQTKQLDTVADAIDKTVRPAVSPTQVRNALSGVWLGHRLHPVLTDVAIGAFTGAALVDVMAPRHSNIARRLIGTGILASLPTAASGLSDWIDVYDDGRRIGLVHAAGNTLALVLYLRSWRRRRNGGGRLSALAGLAVLSASGYLGGHLSYVLGVGVDHQSFNPLIEDWVDAAGSDELAEGNHTVAKLGDNEVLLVRRQGAVRAFDNRCSHAGWALEPGKFDDSCVTCPMHGSQFSLADGSVLRGPAASPQRQFQVKEEAGRIFVRS